MSAAIWEEWSRAAWRRHLPGIEGLDAFVSGLGEATIHGLAHGTAAGGPDRPALRIGDAELSHGELDARAARAAAWLSRRIAPGDRVVISAPVTFDWLGCYLGTLRAGGIAVLTNPTYTEAELEQVRSVAKPTVTLRNPEQAFADPPEAWIERTGPDSVALLAFTSGTTGRPKGVPLTHRQLLTSIRSAMTAWRWSRDDVLVHALPLFHQHGLGGLHATLIAGSSLHLLPHFAADGLLSAIADSQATVLFAVPTMYQRLSGHRSSHNRLRLCISGSAPLSRHVADGAAHALGRIPLVRYGTTETGLDTSHVYADQQDLDLCETIGIPLPGVEVRLGDEGEIQVRGPQVFSGYWQDWEATKAAFTSDGWFRTGDIGRLDEASGHLVIQGRSKDVIITGGLNVHPREVEVALEKHPAVAEAAVAGIASEQWGEQVTAWVVLKPGCAFDAGALSRHARSLLAPYKCPKEVFAMDALPRNHVGKIDRRELLSSKRTFEKES